jgi:1,4-alpha-glucan branching enzyme
MTAYARIDLGELDRLVNGAHYSPHSILGAHSADGIVTIRTIQHGADQVNLVIDGTRHRMTHVHRGVWAVGLDAVTVPDYLIETTRDGCVHLTDDPYSFLPTLGDVDLHLIGEGRHEQLWNALGAHVRRLDTAHGPVLGVAFSVWAPTAQGVRVIGDFNFWDGGGSPMRSLGSTGVWELFIPGVAAGARYKFEILGADDTWHYKADPMAQAAEIPPANASVVTESRYSWNDVAWLAHRAATDQHKQPLSIYEVHLGSWRPHLNYVELADQLTEYVRAAGFTHVEFLPVAAHPYAPSWGYHVTSYFAPTPHFGTPDELRFLIDSLHQAGIGVIMDWVPAHFATDPWALVRFDGSALYEHPDPRRGEHPDWGSFIFDYGRTEVRNFLVANAVYWLEEFHFDGLRVDGVASMLYLDYSRKDGEWYPNEFGGRENLDAVSFLQEMNATVYKRVPGIMTIAEESTAWPGVTTPTEFGGLGFGYKWNMGWMHDSLQYIEREPIHRQYHHGEMTFSMVYAYSEHFILPISHDEVVHGKGSLVGKMPGDRWQELANLRAYLGFMFGHPGKKLLFMGSEFAQSQEWASERGLDWWLLQFPEHQGMLRMVSDLNRVYRDNPALWQIDNDSRGFEWIDSEDAAGNVFSWLRRDESGAPIAVVVNLSPVVHHEHRLALPNTGTWNELITTDALEYGGSGVGVGTVIAQAEPWQGRPASAVISLPPLAATYLKYSGN